MNSLHLPRLTKPPLDSPPFPIGTISLSLCRTANKPLFLIAFLSQFEEFFWLRSDFNVVNVKFAAWRRRSIILAAAALTNIVWTRLPIAAMSNASSAQARALRPIFNVLGRVIQQPSHCTSEGIAHSPLGQ